MSEVKRYMQYRGKMAEREGGKYVLASDLDAREKQWKEVVRELVDNCTSRFTEGGDVISHYVSKDILTKCLTKLFALLNDQPQEANPMAQRKPATKPKAQVREVFEIKPLRWVKQTGYNNYYCHTMPGILTIESSDRGFVARYGFTVMRYSTLRNAKAAAEQWYRQQLGKALRRVK